VCVLLEFFSKNMGNPYYEPTIVVHDNINLNSKDIKSISCHL